VAEIWEAAFQSNDGCFYTPPICTSKFMELRASNFLRGSNRGFSKLEACFAFASKKPAFTDVELINIANKMNLSPMESFFYASLVGCVSIIENLEGMPSVDLQQLIQSYQFVGFRCAAAYGHLSIMNKMMEVAPTMVSDMIKARDWRAFCFAMANGHLLVMNKLVELDPMMLPNLIRTRPSFLSMYFSDAASNGHLHTMEKLMELAPNFVVYEIWKDESMTWSALNGAAGNGHLHVMEKLITLIPSPRLINTIKASDFNIFRRTSSQGHLNTLQKLMALAPDLVPDMIKANNFEPFSGAAKNGHLHILETLMKAAPSLVKSMIKHHDFSAFREAVGAGHLHIVNRLIELTPNPASWFMKLASYGFIDMIESNNFEAFRLAAKYGHLPIMERLMTVAPTKVDEMIKAANFEAFFSAAQNNHINIMLKIVSVSSVSTISKFAICYQEAFRKAVVERRQDDVNHFLSSPEIFAYAESHDYEYDQNSMVSTYIQQKLNTLMQRNASNHLSVVVTQQEAKICCYILRHLIKKSPTEIIVSQIDFLMNVPIVRSLLHEPLAQRIHNELLRLAIQLGRQAIVERFMKIPAVYAQAEVDGFYRVEARGQVDLMAFVNDRESATLVLSSKETATFKRLQKKYPVDVVQDAFKRFYTTLQVRYRKDPAIFTCKNGDRVSLPLIKIEFDALAAHLKWSEAEMKEALRIYYQHSTHTALRYLSKPNHWMSHQSSHVNINLETRERWSTFEEYQDLIGLLATAAEDATESPMDGYTLETRLDGLIKEIALIGRAHNWDRTREKRDTLSGKVIREEYDDLEGDKPSCYSGVRRRLLQALRGHPLVVPDIEAVVSLRLHEMIRNHMREQFKKTPTDLLEATLVDVIRMTQGELVETLLVTTQSWNIREEDVVSFKKQCYEQYSAFFGKEETQAAINVSVNRAFIADTLTSHFLAFEQYAQLDFLIRNELQIREDAFAHCIQQKSSQELLHLLGESNELNGQPLIVNAIHLGLLGTIGQTLGREAFSNLLLQTPELANFYASILVPYSDNTSLLHEWLSTLGEKNKSTFLTRIKECANEPLVFSPLQKFKSFLRTLEDAQSSEIRSFIKAILLINESSIGDVPSVLKPLLTVIQTQCIDIKLANLILNKAFELSLVNDLLRSVVSPQIMPLRHQIEPEIMQHSKVVTYNDLPDDPSGDFLMKYEKNEHAKFGENTSNVYTFFRGTDPNMRPSPARWNDIRSQMIFSSRYY
jgi:hypothetical protein